MRRLLCGCLLASALGSSAGQPAAAPSTRYQCADGTIVDARYPSDDTASIVFKNQSIEMKLAVSASGARYTGGGWQWWTKGRTQGCLAPLQQGEDIASAQGVACTVP